MAKIHGKDLALFSIKPLRRCYLRRSISNNALRLVNKGILMCGFGESSK